MTPLFIGRRHLLEKARQAVEAGLDVHLCGEAGVGKSALARRVAPEALFVAHPSPASEVLGFLLLESYGRGWWSGPASGKDEDEDADWDDEKLLKAIKKMGQKAATAALLGALERARPKAVVVFDNFESAPAAVVRIVREIAGRATIVAVSAGVKAQHKPLLFHCTQIAVPRLSPRESEELAGKLLDRAGGPPMPEKMRAALVRQLVEQAHGLPAVMMELVKRGQARGDLSLRGVRGEEVNGFKTVDMTPGLVIFACGLMMFRGVARGWGDHDWTVFVGASGALLMLFRFYAFRLSRARRS